MEENINPNINSGPVQNSPKNQLNLAGAIIVAGVLIAGAIMLRGRAPVAPTPTAGNGNNIANVQVDPVNKDDRTVGNAGAKVTVIEYADFQCPFCGRFFSDAGKTINDNYVKTGKVFFVYRDFAFLGPESVKAAEAARCANDQGKFWEYHDYLFSHQNGENKGNFADANLKSFAKTLGLDTTAFNQCLDSGKYTKAVSEETDAGAKAGVQGTPKAFILKNGKLVDTIDGAEPSAMVTPKIDKALK